MRCWFQKDCDIKTIGLMHFIQLILKTEPLRKPFEIDGVDPRRDTNSNRRRIYDTLRIFSSGMDAAGYIRSDVSTKSKLAAKSVQGCTLLAKRRSRCPHISKGLKRTMEGGYSEPHNQTYQSVRVF